MRVPDYEQRYILDTISYTSKEIEKLLREGFVVTTVNMVMKKVAGYYYWWSCKEEHWMIAPNVYFELFVETAVDNSFIQYTAEEFSIIRFNL